MSDDEPVDPKQELEERCKAPCTRPLKEYQACAKRIQGDESGQKHCTGQYFDYWQCVDKCQLPFMGKLAFLREARRQARYLRATRRHVVSP